VEGFNHALPALAGLLTGFFGAIPPGPLNVTIIRKASHKKRHDAYRVALGGASVDGLLCGAIGLGFGWILEKVVSQRYVRLGLAFFLLAYGLKVLVWDRRRDKALDEAELDDVPEPTGPFVPPKGKPLYLLVGFLQGAANPALFVNWTIIISFLVSHRLLHPTPGAAVLFAAGVGVGVFLWFALLIEILDRLHDHPIGLWIRRSTFLAGVLLVAFGLYFTFRSIGDFVGG